QGDTLASDYDRGSNYAGGGSTIAITRGRHNFHAGIQAFGERDSQFYQVGTIPPEGPGTVLPRPTISWANTEAAFFEEQVKATSWLPLNGGLRLTHYGGPVSENAVDPRIGAAVQVPHIGWVLRAFYGRYYQAPPLVTVNHPALSPFPCLSPSSPQCFVPLHGE